MLSVIRTTGKTQAEEKVSFKEVIFWKISGSYFYLGVLVECAYML